MTAPASPTAAPQPVPTPAGFSPRQVYAVAGCYFVASFAALGLPPYLSLMLPALGDPSARWAGVLYVVPTVCGALGAPVWGRLADRFGHKPLLLRAQLGLAAAFLLAGLADSLPLFAAALALQGLLGGTYAASNSLLGSGLPDRHALSKALTLMQAAARAALVLAPVTVGVLSPWVSPHRQYLVLALLPLLAALMLTALPATAATATAATATTRPDSPGPTAGPVAEPRPPYRLYALEFGFVLATVVSFPYLVPLVEARASVPAELSGLVFAVPHLLYLVLAAPVHRWVSARPHTGLRSGFALVAIGLAGHALADSVTGLVAVRLVLGLGMSLGLVGLSALAADTCRGRRPGRMFGWLELVSKAGAVMSGLVATAANAAWGPLGPMLAGATVAAVAAALTSGRSPDHPSIPSVDEGA